MIINKSLKVMKVCSRELREWIDQKSFGNSNVNRKVFFWIVKELLKLIDEKIIIKCYENYDSSTNVP